MTTLELTSVTEASRASRLRTATHDRHEALDARIMAAAPFASPAHYARFLRVQYAFYRDIDALYSHDALDTLLPDLSERRRFDLVRQDLADLGVAAAAADRAPVFGGDVDLPTAFGWLYVAEGSNLGAAFLLKDAAKLGFSESHGARHLAAAPEGRGRHWKTFTAALDALTLTEAEEARVIAGGRAAFAWVRGLVDTLMPVVASDGGILA